MDFDFRAQAGLRQGVRDFLREAFTPQAAQEIEADSNWGPHCRGFLRRLGQKGWLAPALPPQYGGIGATHLERFAIAEELDYGGAPSMGVTAGGPETLIGANIIAPSLMRYGSPEQKEKYLPLIARGEVEFAIGFTEPHAGSDLASLELSAIPDGGGFLLRGQKCFSTAAHYARYHWLAARTDPSAPKHRGISLFIADLQAPGVSIQPIWTMSGIRTNFVFYDEVRLPRENLVGEVNRGFYYIVTSLDFERMYTVSGLQRTLEMLVGYVKETGQLSTGGGRVWRRRLAELAVSINVARLLSYRLAWVLDRGLVPNYEASMLKVMGTELGQRLAATGLGVVGLYGQLQAGSPYAPLQGRLEGLYRQCIFATIGGGTSEVQRNIIATRGLGLPRL